MVLEFFGGFEAVCQLPVVVSAGILLGFAGQLDDLALVFGNSLIESFQAGVDADDLFVPND